MSNLHITTSRGLIAHVAVSVLSIRDDQRAMFYALRVKTHLDNPSGLEIVSKSLDTIFS